MSRSAISASALRRLHRAAVLDPDRVGGNAPSRSARRLRMCAWTSCACAGVAVRPVPIAHTGSYAMTSRGAALASIPASAARELLVDDGERAAAVALGERSRRRTRSRRARREHRARLLADALVGVAEELPALAVPDDAPTSRPHRRAAARRPRRSTRRSPPSEQFWRSVAIGVPSSRFATAASAGERRRDADRDTLDGAELVLELGHQRERLGDRLVELPVADDERGAHGRVVSRPRAAVGP